MPRVIEARRRSDWSAAFHGEFSSGDADVKSWKRLGNVTPDNQNIVVVGTSLASEINPWMLENGECYVSVFGEIRHSLPLFTLEFFRREKMNGFGGWAFSNRLQWQTNQQLEVGVKFKSPAPTAGKIQLVCVGYFHKDV